MMLAVAIAIKYRAIVVEQGEYWKLVDVLGKVYLIRDAMLFDLQTYVASRHRRVVLPLDNCLFGN
jgi:hypothetical protein